VQAWRSASASIWPPRPKPAALEPGAVTPVSVKGETGHTVPPEEFLDLLAPAFARWQAQLDTYGFAADPQCLAGARRPSGRADHRPHRRHRNHGIFEGIDDTGALILKTAAGRQVIPAADVYFTG
jgi:BirA family biotin operon repressor/biotin-[acetyl-CoA-carboxylase] ligase